MARHVSITDLIRGDVIAVPGTNNEATLGYVVTTKLLGDCRSLLLKVLVGADAPYLKIVHVDKYPWGCYLFNDNDIPMLSLSGVLNEDDKTLIRNARASREISSPEELKA